MKTLRDKLTYANVVSTLCLFLLLGGGAAFAANQLAKNSVGPKQLKKGAVTTAKIKNGAVTGRKIKLSTLGRVPSASNALNAANADTLGGQPPSSFASAAAIRSVTVGADGGVVGSQSDGVVQANVSHPEKDWYCIDGLNPAPRTAVGSLGFGAQFGGEIFVQVSPSESSVNCIGSQIGVFLTAEGLVTVDQPFSLILH